MKKFFVALFALAMLASFAAADDDYDKGIGLSAGLEFGIGNINKANDVEMSPYIMPMLIYENSFFDEALDIYAEVDYTFGFTKEPDGDDADVYPQSLYSDLMIGYNMGLGDTSTLSFILENEFDEIIISPKYKESNSLTGIFTPTIKFNQELDIGDLFFKIGAPITYIQYDKDADKIVGLDFTVGWNSSFGLGLEAKACTVIVPSDDAGYTGTEAIVSYETKPIYIEVKTIIPKEIGDEGVTVTPEFDYSVKNFTFYVKCEFAGIGISGGNAVISPALGIKYSF
jgi:opacity protein-like surface antigen